MIAIYKRELKAFFQSMIGWLFVAATLFLTGIYFMAVNLMYGSASIASTISSAAFIYILTIPILSMRIIAEERKQKTDQLTLTAPVSIWKIVTGKYLAMATVLLIPIFVVCLYPLILSAFGTISFVQTYVAILGFFLYGLAAIALGLFISSITESQVIAAVVSFTAIFITYMMDGISNLITKSGNVITTFVSKVLSALDFSSRFDDFLNGNFNINAVVYFITVILVCLFLTTQSIQKRRYSISVKNISMGAYSSGLIIIVLAVSVFANLLVNELPDKYTNFDITSQKLYSLSDTTKEFTQNLTDDINIYVLQDEKNKDEVLDSTLKKYEALSKHIKVTYKNPVKSPNFYKQYSSGDISLNSVIVEGQKRYKVIDYSDIYETDVDPSTYQENTTGYDGEGQITSALDYVTREDMPKAYAIEGHDEQALDSGFQSAIEKQNITIDSLNLLNVDKIPQDAEFVMVMAPKSDFSEEDANKVIEYAKNGGKLFATTALVENIEKSMPNFQKILDCYNTKIVNGTIIETDANHYYQDPTYLLPDVQDTFLTDGVYQKKYAFMPYAQGITVDENDDVTLISLLKTTDSAYSKIDLSNAQSLEKTMEDQSGPFDVGVYVKKTYGDKEASLFLFSSINFFTDKADKMVANANLKIFTNCISEYIKSTESAIVIPSKSYTEETLTISSGYALGFGLLLAVILPITLMVIGLVVWLNRRKK